jgi:molybdopterin synthase sulfur carrier subunit
VGDDGRVSVTLRYWAAAKEAAGVAEESFAGCPTLADVVREAVARRDGDERLARVLARCSFLVDGAPAGVRPQTEVETPAGSVVEALPPFAGG